MNFTRSSQQAVTNGLKALERGNREDAKAEFNKGLDFIFQVEEPQKKRDLFSEIATFFLSEKQEELAKDAVLQAIRLDEELDLPAQLLVKDYITYANTCYRMGNIEKAKTGYKKAIEISLDNADFANAASASTNLAMILGQSDLDKEAIDLLSNSMEYLKEIEFPDTDMKTRLVFIQLAQYADVKPPEMIDVAQGLSPYSDSLHPTEKEAVRKALEPQIEQYVKELPTENLYKWKQDNFKWLFN